MGRNGHNRWTVRPSDQYTEHLNKEAPNQPRLREVLEGISFELGRAPFQEDRCWRVEGSDTYWLIESEYEESGPPRVWVTFSVWNQELTLEDFMIVDEWEDQVFE